LKVSRFLTLLVALIFLVVSSGCSHTPKQPPTAAPNAETSSQKDGVYYYTPKEDKWWKKDEFQWLVLTLIILGVAIAAGAAVAVAFGGGGLHIGVSN
jgi:hypothetical protein